MDRAAYIDDITKRLRTIVESAFDRGVAIEQERGDAARKTILEALGVQEQSHVARAPKRRSQVSRPSGNRAAPVEKGVVTKTVAQVMSQSDGLTTREVEERVTAINDTIKVRSVYNELWRQKEQYVQQDNKWFRIGNASSTVNGEPIDLLNRNNTDGGARHVDPN